MRRRDDDIDLWHLAYRHRVGLGPLYLGAATAASGVFASAALSTGQTALSLGAVALTGAALIKTKMRDGLRRVYAYTVLGASTSWAMLAHEVLSVDWAAVTWAAGTIMLAAPWWASHRRHTQVRLDETVRDWPQLSKRIGLGQSKLISVVGTPNGYSGKITWPGGIYDVDSVRGMNRQLEGILPNATRGSIRTELDGKSTNSVRFRVITKDPHEMAQPWPLPNNLRRGTDHMVTGIAEDGTYRTIQRFAADKGARHILIGGATEGGKSSLINLTVAEDVCSEDVWIAGFDFKQVELTPWKPVLGYMTHEVAKARQFILALAGPGGVIDTRAAIMAKNGVRVWDPKWGPWISLVIDEAKNLLGATDPKFLNLYTRVKTEGRAVGIAVEEATQYPTLEAVGSSQGRQQNRYAFCFRMNDGKGESYVLGDGSPRVYAERISEERPGTCYRRDGSQFETAPERILYIDDETRDMVVAVRAGHTVELDAATDSAITALFPEFADRERWEYVPDSTAPGSTGTDGGTGTPVSTGTPDADSGTDPAGSTGTDDAGEGDDEVTSPVLAALRDDAPDMNLAEMFRAKRAEMSPTDRARLDEERAAALAENTEETPVDDAINKLRKAMIQVGESGLPARELAKIAGRQRTWLYDQLNAWAAEGHVRRVKHGHWAWMRPQLVSVKDDAE